MKSDEKAKMRNQEKQKKYLFIKENITGITLVALVVTIVVLLILAGITLNYLFGDNSILDKASEARLKTDVVSWKEKLEIAKGPNIIQGLGTFDPDKYFEYIEEQGIIKDKNIDVVDNMDGTYEVTVVPGYVFDVELIPTKEDPNDAKIEYAGETGKLPPKIRTLVVTEKEETSCNIEVVVLRFKIDVEEGKINGTCTTEDGMSKKVDLTLIETTEKTQKFTAKIIGLTKEKNMK